MYQVKILGAGSIGNHLAHAARCLGWRVTIVDRDAAALQRTRTQIYPQRYGAWDETIQLFESDKAPRGGFDLIIVGTPPDSHLPLAQASLAENPRAILIEKPLCQPDLRLAQDLYEQSKHSPTKLFVGYDHSVSRGVQAMERMRSDGIIGSIQTLDVEFREHWGGIFAAHPWLNGPADSYLGFWKRGGGSSGEHSHAIHLWQHLAHECGFGKVVEVSANIQYVRNGDTDYDSICLLHLQTEGGLIGRVVQDVVTTPSRKMARLQGELGALTWLCSSHKGGDIVMVEKPGQESKEVFFRKTRPDDFIEELKAIQASLNGEREAKGIDWVRGLETMLVIAAAHRAEREERRMRINYDAGFRLNAVSPSDSKKLATGL